jgi:ABC-type glycerol-3-phosphate transport system permease component
LIRGTARTDPAFILAFVAFVALVLLPVYYIALSSVTPLNELLSYPPHIVPSTITFDNYRKMATQLPFGSYLMNSLVFSLCSALLSVVLAFIAAYAFARYDFRGRRLMFLVFLLSAALPQITTVIPLFRTMNALQLIDTKRGLVLLECSLLLPFTIWLLTSFIQQVPKEIEESARIDGADLPTILLRIVLPLTMPALATLFIINFVIAWNELFYPLVFSTSANSKTLTRGLLELTKGVGTGSGRPWDLMSAMSAVMILPVVLLVASFQRLIVGGLTRGALK